MTTPMTIRASEPTDYPALSRLGDLAYADADGVPMLPMSAESIADDDADQVPPRRSARWVVELDGELIGGGEYSQNPDRYDPRRFWMDVYVHPEHRGRGWGTRLYDLVASDLDRFGAQSARCAIREDGASGLAFAEERGWVEEARSWESFLDLERSALPSGKPSASELGVEIHTLAALEADPERDRRLYDLIWEIDQDVPEIDEPTRESLEDFVESRLAHRRILPEYCFVALHDGEYVGVSFFMSDDSDPELVRTALTGVARDWRGRGLAWALKLEGLDRLARSPFRTVRTVNESGNRHMLTINEQLGFVKRPAWIDMVKHFA